MQPNVSLVAVARAPAAKPERRQPSKRASLTQARSADREEGRCVSQRHACTVIIDRPEHGHIKGPYLYLCMAAKPIRCLRKQKYTHASRTHIHTQSCTRMNTPHGSTPSLLKARAPQTAPWRGRGGRGRGPPMSLQLRGRSRGRRRKRRHGALPFRLSLGRPGDLVGDNGSSGSSGSSGVAGGGRSVGCSL